MSIDKAKNNLDTNNGRSIIKIGSQFQTLDTSKDVEPDFTTLQNLNVLNFNDSNYYWLGSSSGVFTPISPTPTRTATPTPSVTQTLTSTVTPTITQTIASSETLTPTPTITTTETPTVTPTITPSPTPSSTPSPEPLFLVSTDNSNNARSSNGSDWTYGNFTNSRSWIGLVHGTYGYLVVAYNSNNYETSSDAINWTNNTYNINHPNNLFTKTIYADNKYLIFANSSTGFYSEDLEEWDSFILPGSNWVTAAYGNGTYVVVADNSSVIATSSDLVTWTQRALPVSRDWKDIIYDDGRFVLIGYNTNTVLYSSNGIDWSTSSLPTANLWISISYGDNKYVALIKGSSITAYSEDASSWTQGTAINSNWTDLTYGNNIFVAISTGTVSMISSNGLTWTQRTLNNNNWNNIVFNS